MNIFKAICVSLFIPFFAQAETMICTISQTGPIKNTTTISYELVEGAPHGIQPFDVEYATGFVAVSRGYTVIHIQTKADHRAFSFHGKRIAGENVGGATCLADADSCISIECR